MARTPMGERSRDTKEALQAEAERRARGGEALTAIAAGLQVSPSTIGRWAARGHFRQTDLQRERDGLPPLPVAAWALAPSARKQTEAKAGETDPQSPPKCERPPSTDLAGEAAALAREALALVRAGRIKSADDKLRAADRLLRIQKRLGPAENKIAATGYSEKVQAARDRIFNMSKEDLVAEIKRIAGVTDNRG
ncbi:MAG: hypothetical protein AAGK23_13510 [Pseudomonadota bacterium]